MRKTWAVVCALLASCTFGAYEARAQTVLSAGDLAFTGYGSTGTDQFSFVLLRDVVAGTTITFTDRGWLASGGFRPGERAFELTFTADQGCGAEFHATMSPLGVVDAGGLPAGTTSGSGLQLSTSGDQVFAYQGAAPTADDPSGLVAAIHMNGGWDADAINTNTSALPGVLTDGLHAVAIAPETNNARYDCDVSSAEPAVLAGAAHDAGAWLREDAVPFDLSATCGFVCESACVAPDLPAISGETTLAAGQGTTLSVDAGALGGATDWQWYVEGCGATRIGSGEALEITPASTVEVFVRGEGGCVTPGACSMLTVTVEPPAPAPQRKEQQKCLNTMLGRVAVVAGLQGGEVLKCAKGFAKGKIESAESCVAADATGKIAKARAKTADLAARRCVELPDFGYAGPDLVAGAGEDASLGWFTDLFGVAFDGAILPDAGDRLAARCQQAVAAAARKCFDARLKELARCAHTGLKAGSITGPAGLAACIGADPKGRIAAACDRGVAGDKKIDGIRKSLARRCVAADRAPLLALPFCPGAVDVESAHACLTTKIACRACLAADAAGALGAPCDLLDDGVQNGSCPP